MTTVREFLTNPTSLFHAPDVANPGAPEAVFRVAGSFQPMPAAVKVSMFQASNWKLPQWQLYNQPGTVQRQV